jgi:hypothetical protein
MVRYLERMVARECAGSDRVLLQGCLVAQSYKLPWLSFLVLIDINCFPCYLRLVKIITCGEGKAIPVTDRGDP